MGRADPEAVAALDDHAALQFAALGVTVERGAVEAPVRVEVWDVCWGSVEVFIACRTQWRILPLPRALVYLGLDYPGVDVVMRRLAPAGTETATLWLDLQVMEEAALAAFNEDPS